MSSKSRRSFARLTAQVRSACGPIHQTSDIPLAAPSLPDAAAGEVSKSMADLYRQFLTEPSAERFFAALAAFELPAKTALPSLESLSQAFSEGRFETVRTLVRRWSRYFALSVHFHRLAALAALELGELDDAELERFVADACLQGVLHSGDGSADHPYFLAHRADAQEVLAKLKLKPLRQSCLENAAGLCDVFQVKTPKAEREVWFSLRQYAVAPSPSPKTRPKRAKKVAV